MTDTPSAAPPLRRRRGFDPAPDPLAGHDGARVTRITTPFGTAAWLVTGYADVRAVLADPVRFSNAGPQPGFDPGPDAPGPDGPRTDDQRALTEGNLLTADPPEHTRLRRMLGGRFTARRMRELAPRVERIVADHLDAMEQAGPPADLVADFALPVPSLVICELLGVPYADRAEFQQRTARQLDATVAVDERLALLRQVHEYLAELTARARAEPGDDLLGTLVREHGDELTAAQLTGMALLLLTAGHETTASMLGLGVLALLRHPEQLAAVRDDPAAVGPAVEELLRWLSIIDTGVQRTAVTDVELGGAAIRAGDGVVLAFPSANRDPALVDDPDRLDIARGAAGHLGFGHGIHHCLGAPLARLEMRTAFPALLRRFPDLALAVPPDEVAFRSDSAVHGVVALPVTW